MTTPTLLAIIPARGGSKGLPRKNLLMAGGKPLLAWTIDAARSSRHISRTIVSSDDKEIMAAALAHGCECPFRRPAELADDFASSLDVVRHTLERLPGYDYVALLQPTSPLRTADDIDRAFESMLAANSPSCVSLTSASEIPHWMLTMDRNGRVHPLMNEADFRKRRQDLPAAYSLNGAIYLARTEWFIRHGSFIGPETVGYIMPSERAIDIDTQPDFDEFLAILAKKELALHAGAATRTVANDRIVNQFRQMGENQ